MLINILKISIMVLCISVIGSMCFKSYMLAALLVMITWIIAVAGNIK